MNSNKKYAYLLFLSISLLILAHISSFGEDSAIFRVIHNMGHLPMFSVLTFIIIFVLNKINLKFNIYWASFIISSMLAILMELIQIPTGRDSDIDDLILDFAGITCCILIYASFKLNTQKRYINIILAFVIVAVVLAPYIKKIITLAKIEYAFPLICDFENSSLSQNLSSFGCQLETHDVPDNWAQNKSYHCGSIIFDTITQYSGIEIDYVPENWAKNQMLMIEFFYNGQQKDRVVIVRVNDDNHSGNYSDRFSQSNLIKPGHNSFIFPLSDIKKAPVTRDMDLSKIKEVIIFTVQNDWDDTLFIDNIRLL